MNMQKVTALEAEAIRAMLPARSPRGHKGDFGHVLTICGSERYQGAAVLAALGAVHSGAGLVTAAFPRAAYAPIAAKLTTTPLLPLPGNRQGTLHISALPALRAALPGKSAVLLGCGLGLNADTKELVRALLHEIAQPLVLDADALNALAALEGGINAVGAHINSTEGRLLRRCSVLTPHPGEMARLCGCSVEQIAQSPAECAERFAREWGVVLVLKGAQTVVAAPGLPSAVCPLRPNTGLAKGGSGDLLAGMIASLLALGLRGYEAAVCGVYFHGVAAASAARRYSARGMTALDCVEEMKRLFNAANGESPPP
jgi:NAD(P)H-hydrate epimerase